MYSKNLQCPMPTLLMREKKWQWKWKYFSMRWLLRCASVRLWSLAFTFGPINPVQCYARAALSISNTCTCYQNHHHILLSIYPLSLHLIWSRDRYLTRNLWRGHQRFPVPIILVLILMLSWFEARFRVRFSNYHIYNLILSLVWRLYISNSILSSRQFRFCAVSLDI